MRSEHDAVDPQLRVFKYGTTGSSQRVSTRVPTASQYDPVWRLFRCLYLLGKVHPESQCFAPKDLPLATTSVIAETGERTPPGTSFTPAPYEAEVYLTLTRPECHWSASSASVTTILRQPYLGPTSTRSAHLLPLHGFSSGISCVHQRPGLLRRSSHLLAKHTVPQTLP